VGAFAAGAALFAFFEKWTFDREFHRLAVSLGAAAFLPEKLCRDDPLPLTCSLRMSYHRQPE